MRRSFGRKFTSVSNDDDGNVSQFLDSFVSIDNSFECNENLVRFYCITCRLAVDTFI